MELGLELGNGYKLENLEVHDRKILDCLTWIVGRNVNNKGVYGKGAEGFWEHVVEN